MYPSGITFTLLKNSVLQQMNYIMSSVCSCGDNFKGGMNLKKIKSYMVLNLDIILIIQVLEILGER